MEIKKWLDYLFYEVGKQKYNFKLCHLQKQADGSIEATKWKTYWELVFPLDYNEGWKLDGINQRQILPNEFVLDIENKKDVNEIVAKINEKFGNPAMYLFKTGSRGYHLHIFFKIEIKKEQREQFIKFFCPKADIAKASNNSMIALEFMPHWKTGKIKELVYEWK